MRWNGKCIYCGEDYKTTACTCQNPHCLSNQPPITNDKSVYYAPSFNDKYDILDLVLDILEAHKEKCLKNINGQTVSSIDPVVIEIIKNMRLK